MNGLRVLFRAAAGPRLGFGHAVRCRSIARALGATAVISVRGTETTRHAVRRLGFRLLRSDSDRAVVALAPDVVVVDDPSAFAARVWVNRARRIGIPVATIHDLGLACVEADMCFDGGIRPGRQRRGRLGDFRGPAFTILDPAVAQVRAQNIQPVPGRLLIALGGGAHVHHLAGALAEAVIQRRPDVTVRVAAGFTSRRRPRRVERVEWKTYPGGLATELANASVAIVAGGITLYEACALGVPAVAMALNSSQHLAIAGLSRLGAVIDGGSADAIDLVPRVADAVVGPLTRPAVARRMSRAGRAAIDGRGVYRVAERLVQLAHSLDTSDAA